MRLDEAIHIGKVEEDHLLENGYFVDTIKEMRDTGDVDQKDKKNVSDV